MPEALYQVGIGDKRPAKGNEVSQSGLQDGFAGFSGLSAGKDQQVADVSGGYGWMPVCGLAG